MLLLFCCLPIALGCVLYFVFVRLKIHRRKQSFWLRLLLGNMLLLLFLVSLVLLSGEIYVRFYYDTTESFGLSKTTRRWFDRHFVLNNIGFRDSVPYWPATRPGSRRLTFFGDSFTAGHGIADVEDRFANRIRAMHPDDEIHVFATCGWDTGHELQALNYFTGANYQLEEVVLVYCLNDIADIDPEWDRVSKRIYDTNPSSLLHESYFLDMLSCRFRAARDPDIGNYYGFIRDSYSGGIWQRERLIELVNFVRGQGGRITVVTFPFLHSLGPDYPYRNIHTKLDRLWREHKVPHLDLLDIFETRSPSELVVNSRDVHPNEFAHELAAAAINEFLEDFLQRTRSQQAGASDRDAPR
ncbi:MAG: hypothetical protein IID46_10105 [Planctomycetes bacterium]|nr:hypothetical protein [Planctomycetota bacterium]